MFTASCVLLSLDVVDDDGYSATTYPSPPRLCETRLPSHLLDCRTLSVACFNPNTHILHTLTSILGEVFDVTKGKKHYGKGGSYEFFTGKDASRSFVSGDFSQVGIGWSTTPSVLSFGALYECGDGTSVGGEETTAISLDSPAYANSRGVVF